MRSSAQAMLRPTWRTRCLGRGARVSEASERCSLSLTRAANPDAETPGGLVLKPKRDLLVALLLFGIGLGGAFFAARVSVNATNYIDLVAYQQSEAEKSLAAGDVDDAEKRERWAAEFAAEADSLRSIAVIVGLGAAVFGIPGAVLALRVYRSPARSTAAEAAAASAATRSGHRPRPASPGPNRPAGDSNAMASAKVRSHRGRSTDVFVSYAREDQHFVRES